MRIPFTNLELKTFVINRLPGQASTLSSSTYSGVSVTEETALNCVAVFACIRLLAESLASLPLHLYKRLPRGKERAVTHTLYSILHDSPNSEMTSFTFRETLMSHLVGWGNAYALIDWKDYSTVSQLIPLRPDRMRVQRNWETKQIEYQYFPLNEAIPSQGGMITFPAWRIFHIPGLGFDGIVGYSPLTLARQAIGLSMAAEEFGARFFGQGTNVGAVVEHPKTLSQQAHENLKKDLQDKYQGLGKSHLLMLLEEGMKFNNITLPMKDAQFLETRKFQIEEIARFYHIPPHMIGNLEHATFSNIEHQALEFVTYTMRPWLVRWEQTIFWKLFSPQEKTQYFAEFLIDGLMRGDSVARSQYYRELFYIGAFSPNDVREKENMNPVPGGDEYYIPVNMLPAGVTKTIKTMEVKAIRKPGGERHRIALAYQKVFADAAQKVVAEEKTNVLKAARRYFTRGKNTKAEGDWSGWLENFYKEFISQIKKRMNSAIQSLADAIQIIAMNEINIEDRQDISKFVGEYSDTFSRRYIESSIGQLKAVVKQAALDGTDALSEIEERLDEWEERRPNKVAMNETVQLSCAVAKAVFIGAGITHLVWAAMGSNTCPICEELDGRIVGIQDKFNDNTGQVSSAGHPPIHEGCVCQIVPG